MPGRPADTSAAAPKLKWGYGIGALLLGLGIWQATVWLTDAPHYILPSPWRVAQAALFSHALIWENTLVTGTEVLLGLLIGTVFGVISAVLLASSRQIQQLILPILVFTQAVPVFALAPMLTLWFGYGMASKIVMTVLIIYFPVTSAFHDGLTQVNRGYLDLGQTMGATKAQIMWRIRIPYALPTLGTGLRLAAVYAPIGAVIGEWVGASNGLGYLMLLANGRAKIDLMFASLIALAILTLLLHKVIGVLADRLSRYSNIG
ncbi:MAG: ABC transporter permease [Rhodobacteraceae bacterium]|nr:ABC transporter permease [Paracoccaceae bacterium]